MSANCLAAAADEFGDASILKVHLLPRRAPGTGEIEVQVHAASVNPIDVRRRSGYGRKLFSLIGAAKTPLVLGNDFAGIVTAVGRGVAHIREGDAVFGAKPPSSAGTHATHVIVRAEHAVLQPSGMPEAALATLPYNFLTVSRALANVGITSENARGSDVLVYGASGGLGLLGVWILNNWGARVTAVGGSAGLDACRTAGAAIVIDRHRQSLHDLPRRFAATLNFANWDDEAQLLRLLAPGALGHATTVHPMLGNFDRLGLLGGALVTMAQKRRMRVLAPGDVRYSWTVFRPDRNALSLLATSATRLVISEFEAFSLDEAVLAHRHVEQRLPGRAVLLPPRI